MLALWVPFVMPELRFGEWKAPLAEASPVPFCAPLPFRDGCSSERSGSMVGGAIRRRLARGGAEDEEEEDEAEGTASERADARVDRRAGGAEVVDEDGLSGAASVA